MTRRRTQERRSSPLLPFADEDGSTLLLTIFYGFLCLVLIMIVTAASSLYLERKRLFTLADGAALAGAEAFDLDEVTESDGGVRPELDSDDVAESVDVYLRQGPATRFEDLTVVRADSADGVSATVTLAAFWRPPVLTLLVPAGIPLQVTSVGRSVFR